MKNIITKVAVAAVLSAGMAAPAVAFDHHGGGHAQMQSSQTVVDIAVGSPDHTTLVTAVQAAGLAGTLSGDGPFTVFAPTNDAFAKLPAGTVESLVQPANRETLTAVLTYHVVAGELKAADVLAAIEAGGGSAVLTTVQGAELTASLSGDSVILTDAAGGTATVTATDLDASNGVVHVIDTVVMPQ